VLLYFVLCIVTIILSYLSYLLYLRSHELNDLRKYAANLESDLLQKQIKVEENAQFSNLSQDFALQNAVDPVTGLPSPQVFEDRAQQTLYLGKRFGKVFGIIFLDIHDFSTINKELGFEKGNHLLSEIGKKMHGCIRQIDTLSRYRDDIFLFLLPQLTQPETAAYVAQRVLAKLQDPFYIDEQLISIKASLGIAIFPGDGDNLNTLFDHANNALEQAKSSRGLQYHFYNSDIQKISQREMQISGCVNSENITENLVCYCSPQVNVTTNHIVGINMTAYIDDPILGLLTQSDYQHIAERENKMIIILEWLIKQAMVHVAEWQKQGVMPDRIVMPVSARQIQHKDFVESIANILSNAVFDPRLIAFEVAADSFADSASTLQESFLRLKHIGVQLAVGVSSLGHLALQKIMQLPLTYLKIDQRVVLYAENEVILSTLKGLTRSMDLFMVVEGVDAEGQKEMLQGLGFEVMQGKCFGELKTIQSFMH